MQRVIASSLFLSRMGRFQLCPGLRGFLLFTNHREKDALREGYSVLNEYADTMYGKETTDNKEQPDKEVLSLSTMLSLSIYQE